jgi:hypothetical protein
VLIYLFQHISTLSREMSKFIKVAVPKTDVAKAAALMADGYRLNSVIEARGRVPAKNIYVKEVAAAPKKEELDRFAAMFSRLGLEQNDVAVVNAAAPSLVAAAAPAAVAAAPGFFAPVQGNLFEANANPYAMNEDGGGAVSARKGRKQRKTRRRRNGGKSRRGRTYNRRS